MTIQPRELIDYCDRLLGAGAFADYAPNGLQVEGVRPVARLITGVTASAALILAARDAGADAILVHHGWFWKGENHCLVGPKGRRARLLIDSGASLIAYHLPLDAHPTLGNNATLADRLGVRDARPADGHNGLLWTGRLEGPLAPGHWAAQVSRLLGRTATLIQGSDRPIERLAWCTGGGQGHLEAAAGLGVDAYLSGELSEQTMHLARELDICYLAGGHHATERYGVAALGEHLALRFGLEHRFIDIDNPA
jgi:dinuclear metal center YbgI/SA1388 family protein